MKFPALILPLFVLLVGKSAGAQSFEGVWKGTSLCQVKSSPCHDEIVVYYISKNSTDKSYGMNMNKIVNGKEEVMETLSFTYYDKQKVFVSIDSVSNARWEFNVFGNTMKGRQTYKGYLYRVVDVKREN